MPRNIAISLALALILACTACSASPPPSPTAQAAPTNTAPPTLPALPSASPSPSPTFTPTPPAPANTHYTITAVLDYPAHQLQVDQTIRYTNRSNDPLQEIILMVDPLYYPGTFSLQSISWGDGIPVDGIETKTGWLSLPLATTLSPTEEISINLAYTLDLPSPAPSAAIRPIPFGYTERQTNLVDWYPFIPPYVSGQGWLSHPASFYGEHLAYETADFTVNLRFAEPNPKLVLAASAVPIRDGEWYRFEHGNARNFAFSVSPDYQTLTTQVGDITITSYAFGGQESANQAVLDATADSVELYSRIFGPYPRQSLSVVEADFLDGMEYDGMYFLSKGFYNLYQGNPAEYLVAIAAHETAHQWWYAIVGNDQAVEPWLDEALSTYSERLFFENVHPEALDWWWDYRVNYYHPRGWVDTTIYNPHGDSEPYRAYRDAVYLNGAVFLEELRSTIGDPAFFSFLKAYLSNFSGKLSSFSGFVNTLHDFTPVDLEAVFKKYFYQSQ